MSAPPALIKVDTSFNSFLVLVLVFVDVAAKRDGIFLAGKLRMISSGLFVISLLFRSGSSHSSLEISDALSSPDWIWALLTGTTFCLAEHERVDY